MPPPFRQAENAREKPRENTMPGKTHPAGALRRPFLTFRTPAFKLNADFSLSGDKRAVAAQTQGGDTMRPVQVQPAVKRGWKAVLYVSGGKPGI